jgi:hypothetical protein
MTKAKKNPNPRLRPPNLQKNLKILPDLDHLHLKREENPTLKMKVLRNLNLPRYQRKTTQNLLNLRKTRKKSQPQLRRLTLVKEFLGLRPR